ncbi:MAG: proton-conducting transporter membrane subunit [Caulobacterales bacterium]
MNAILTHAPALFVVLPFVAAAIAALCPRHVAAWIAAITACLVLALTVGYEISTEGARPLIYAFGGFAPPAGITFRIDDFNIIPIILISAIGAVAALHTLGDGAHEASGSRGSLAPALLLLEIGALLGVASTGDAFNLFVFLEVASVSAYGLVALGGDRDKRGFKAAFDYLIFGALGASFYVVGVGFLYMSTGSLNFADIAARLRVAPAPQLEAAAYGFLFTGLALKAAMFPLHGWLPRAYALAPSFATALLAGASGAAALLALARVTFGVFGDAHPMIVMVLQTLAAPLGAAAILWGGLRAIYAKDARLMLSFSAVAEAGFLFLGLSLGTQAALAAVLVKIIADGLGKTTLFVAAASARRLTSSTSVESWRGAFARQPAAAAALSIGLASTLGAPLTLGFVGKWLLVDAAIARGWIWAAVIMVIGSILPVIYVGRSLERVLFQPGPPAPEGVKASPFSIAPILLCAAALVITGVASAPLVDAAGSAAAELMAEGAR